MITTEDFNYTINTFDIQCCLIPLALAFTLINEPGNLQLWDFVPFQQNHWQATSRIEAITHLRQFN